VEILAHRGKWSLPDQRNTAAAFAAAWGAGHGIETDLRDLDGEVVVSHDPPRRATVKQTFGELLQRWDAAGRRGRLALNIKADGLAVPVATALEAAEALEHAFVFDMSVPDQLAHRRTRVPVFTRWSDIEALSAPDGTRGLWLDALRDDAWWSASAVREQLVAGRQVVLVSPELHGRDHEAVWERVADAELHRHEGFALCTDHPADAEERFA